MAHTLASFLGQHPQRTMIAPCQHWDWTWRLPGALAVGWRKASCKWTCQTSWFLFKDPIQKPTRVHILRQNSNNELTMSDGSTRGCFTWRSSSFSDCFLFLLLRIAGFVLEVREPFFNLKKLWATNFFLPFYIYLYIIIFPKIRNKTWRVV